MLEFIILLFCKDMYVFFECNLLVKFVVLNSFMGIFFDFFFIIGYLLVIIYGIFICDN